MLINRIYFYIHFKHKRTIALLRSSKLTLLRIDLTLSAESFLIRHYFQSDTAHILPDEVDFTTCPELTLIYTC